MGVEVFKTISLENVKGILWDLDNTLYKYDPVHAYAMERCRELAKLHYGIVEPDFDTHFKAGRNKVHKDLHGQGSSHSRLLYFQKMYESMHGKTNAEFALQMESCYWNNFLNRIEWVPEAKSFIEKAASKNIRMCVVTDLTAQIQLLKWQKMELHRYMDFMVSSEEAGIEKPEKGIFELALSKLGLKPEEVIMIGDSAEKDIEGAERMGIKAYHS